MNFLSLLLAVTVIVSVTAETTVVDLAQDIVRNCLLNFHISGCVKPRALTWANKVSDDNVIRITNDLYLLKKFDPEIQV